ncbi:MAG TPA: DMT family transporter [Nitrospirota bacterium]|nr:DMT family transporter [Nitrospirota bacterium]
MRTHPWVAPAVLAMVLWGVWGVFQKLATRQMPPRNVYFISALGAVSVVFAVLATTKFPKPISVKGAFFGILAGICSSLGGLLFLQAISRGGAAIVITFTGLYPLVSITVSFILLHETITLKQGIGIVLALISIVLLV